MEAAPFCIMVKVLAESYLKTPLPLVRVKADSSLVQAVLALSQAKQVAVSSVTVEEPVDHSLALQERSPEAQMTSEVAPAALSGTVS